MRLGHVFSRVDHRGECLPAKNGHSKRIGNFSQSLEYLPMRSGKSKDWKIEACLNLHVNKKAIKRSEWLKNPLDSTAGAEAHYLKIWVIVGKVYIFTFRHLKRGYCKCILLTYAFAHHSQVLITDIHTVYICMYVCAQTHFWKMMKTLFLLFKNNTHWNLDKNLLIKSYLKTNIYQMTLSWTLYKFFPTLKLYSDHSSYMPNNTIKVRYHRQ